MNPKLKKFRRTEASLCLIWFRAATVDGWFSCASRTASSIEIGRASPTTCAESAKGRNTNVTIKVRVPIFISDLPRAPFALARGAPAASGHKSPSAPK